MLFQFIEFIVIVSICLPVNIIILTMFVFENSIVITLFTVEVTKKIRRGRVYNLTFSQKYVLQNTIYKNCCNIF